MTAANPEEANHSDRTMDEALLSRSLRQLKFMFDKLTETIAYCSENDSEESSKFANLGCSVLTRNRNIPCPFRSYLINSRKASLFYYF